MLSGIYCIENKTDGKKYIGQARNLNKRKSEHLYYLKNNIRENSHLKNAYNKYGKENFIFKILIYCEPHELAYYEQFFVNSYNPEQLYNIRLECVENNLNVGGENHPMYGKHHSIETRIKMSEAKMGKIIPFMEKSILQRVKRKYPKIMQTYPEK